MTKTEVDDPGRPNRVQAEEAVLGACLLDEEAVAVAAGMLTAEDFYRPAHQTIFEAVLGQWETGYPTDGVSISAALEQRGLLLRIGGLPFLHTLMANTPTASNVAWWAQLVADQATRARLVDAAVRVQQLALKSPDDTPEVLEQAREVIEAATFRQVSVEGDGTWIGDVVDEHVAAWERPVDTGVEAPFADLNEVIGGLRAGQVCIVAGRPGSGKSTIATDWAVAAAEAGHSVMLASLEMGRGEVLDRMIAAKATLRMTDIRARHLTGEDRARAGQYATELGKLPIRIEDRFVSTFAAVRSKARECRRSESGLDFLIVDHIGLLSGTDSRVSRQEQVASFSRGFKLLAHEFGIPVLVVSQLNRGTEQRQDKVPVLSDLRESGALEQDADMVILVHRPDYYERESPRSGEADLILAKNRNGPTATITVAHQLHYGRFRDLARGF